jgi:lysozyme
MNFEQIVDQLIEHEGMVLHAYDDHLGNATIGVGRLITKDRGITEEEARYLLENDITLVCDQLDRSFPWWIEAPEQVRFAMIDLCFNMGIGRLSQFSRTLMLLEAGEYLAASVELLDSNYARQLPGRSVRISEMIASCDGSSF